MALAGGSCHDTREGLLRTHGFPAFAGSPLSCLDRTIPLYRSAPEVKTKPDTQVAEPAIQVIEELERNAGDCEEKPALPSEERKQASIQDDDADESSHRKGEQLTLKSGKKQENTGQPHQCNAQPLPSFEVQVIRGFLALENKA